MKVTTRDLVILGVFSALLCFGCWLFLRQGPSDGDEPPLEAAQPDSKAPAEPATTPSRAAAGAFVSALPLGSIPPEYKLIVDRKLFTPLITPPARSVGGSGGGRPARIDLGPIPSIIPPVPVTGSTRPVPAPPQPPTPPPPAPRKEPERPPLAFTGLLRIGGNKAIIENTKLGTSRSLGVGESAWGWQVAYIDVKAGQLGLSSTDPLLGKVVVLKLGTKQQVESLKSGYSEGGGQPGQGDSPGGPPMAGPSPEQMKRRDGD